MPRRSSPNCRRRRSGRGPSSPSSPAPLRSIRPRAITGNTSSATGESPTASTSSPPSSPSSGSSSASASRLEAALAFCARSRRRSRRQALEAPDGPVAQVAQAVVQARRAALPELDAARTYAIAAPVRRARDPFAVRRQSLARRGHLLLEPLPAGNDAALRRSPGADARGQWTGGKVDFRFPRVELRRHAFDADLPLQLHPVEQQRGRRPGSELGPLATFVVGEEGEAAAVDALEQHDARRWRTVGGDRG